MHRARRAVLSQYQHLGYIAPHRSPPLHLHKHVSAGRKSTAEDSESKSHLMTQLASTSFTPSMPPVPEAPPALPSAAHTGAMGNRMLARKATNSDCESSVEICCKRRLDEEAVAILTRMIGPARCEERRDEEEGREVRPAKKRRWPRRSFCTYSSCSTSSLRLELPLYITEHSPQAAAT